MTAYVPQRGDVVWIDLHPRIGHEQSGHRPALVLSPVSYNARRGMLIACPMTSRLKDNPFEAIVDHDPPSAVLADQVRSLDWRTRGARFKERASAAIMAEVIGKLSVLIGA